MKQKQKKNSESEDVQPALDTPELKVDAAVKGENKKKQNTKPVIKNEVDASTPLEGKRRKKRKSKVLLAEATTAHEDRRGESDATTGVIADEPKKKKKKKKKDAENAEVATTKQPEETYVVGSLSSLFGAGSASTSVGNNGEISIPRGETVIRPKKQATDVKAHTSAVEHAEDREGDGISRKDRTKQRQNRKKAHEQRMTLDEKKRTLFVGNAPLSMDERACKKLFAQYGSIESVRMRSLMPNKQTISKRIAHIAHDFHEKQTSVNFYVKFKEEDSVQKALAYNGTIVDRHRIRVDTCMSKAEYDRKLTVFVGNLPLDANEDELAEFFEENVGGVSFVRCVKDQATGMGKGFAFVVFKSPSSVPLALGLTGLQFQKRELRITKVMKKAKVTKMQQAKKRSSKGAQLDQHLTKDQLLKINKYKFSTRKSNEDQRLVLNKKARKAIQRKKHDKQSKSLMQ